tara:strand:- start:764 stop:1690 length:927 start_codon:yes stop_codon:yes gene_type:complete
LSIRILNPGLQTTIQDLGRNGYSHYGVSSSGAADDLSFRLGNLIVGNKENLAAIEMTLLGGDYKFDIDANISLTGSKFDAKIEGESLHFYKNIPIQSGQLLSIGQSLQGSRCYLAVRGGIDINDVLSAKTTHLTSKIGGVDGRSLKKDDVLIIGEEQKLLNPIKINEMLDINMSKLLIIKGLQSNYISKSTWKIFLNQEYIVSNLSNRMGIRLEGNSLKLDNENEIITEGVPLGAIQLPSNGYPIISFVEHQTTGGYPKIANVISSELHKVGQLKPGDKFQFELVSLEEAEALRHEREFYIKRMVDHG